MMNPPPIIVISSSSPSESPVPLQTGIRTRRSFCVRQSRRNSKGNTPSALLPQQQNAELASSNVRRSRSASPSSAKRKELICSPGLKRKYLRQVKLLPLPQFPMSKGRKSVTSEVSVVITPSTFEEELADHENQSPNDPEFVRRASERWCRRTGVVQMQQPFQLLSQTSCSLQPTLQCPSSPILQPAYERHVSLRVIHYPTSPFNFVSPSPITGAPPFRRRSLQYSSLNTATTESTFRRCSRSYSSFGSGSRSRVHLRTGDHSPSRSPGLDRLLKYAARSVSPSRRKGERKTSERRALDDIATEEIKKKDQKERLSVNPDGSSLTTPFRRLSAKIRKSFRGSKDSSKRSNNSNTKENNLDRNSSYSSSNSLSSSSLSSSSSYYSNDSTPLDASSFTSSTSYQSFLSNSSGYSSDCSSCPSSPTIVSRRLSSSSIPHYGSVTTRRLTFQDIFIDEPQIVDNFAIMFPTEPRPEWHRHLRQVINKAGQKIFKKGETHETTIPENLRHQLKHIYVY